LRLHATQVINPIATTHNAVKNFNDTNVAREARKTSDQGIRKPEGIR
jgi:hypothetical protein